MKSVPFISVQRGFTRDGADFFIHLREQQGDRVMMDIPILPRVYFLFHPDDVHAALVTHSAHLEKPALMLNVLKSSFGMGLFTANGEEWRARRRLMQPTFHHAKIGKYAERMVDLTEKHVGAWGDEAEVELDAEMHALTFKIVIDALFSADASGDAEIVGKAMTELGQGVAAQGNNMLLALLPDWAPLPILRSKRHGIETINRIIFRMIQDRRALGEEASPHDLLSALLFTRDAETGETMSDAQLRDELMTLYIAGHETTALLLGWAFALLAQNPDAEALLHAEVDAGLGERPPTLADLPNLRYTEQILKETLRLYPPAFFVMRQTNAPVPISSDLTLPKGVIVFMVSYATQRDARWFHEPHRFMPERWANDYEKTLPKGAYFPFSAGPRVCIGNGFALMEAQLSLANIARRFRIQPLTQPRPAHTTTTLGFSEPVKARITKR